MMHETWAYEIDSDHGNFMRYNRDQQEMYNRLSACYKEMAIKYQMPLIPCGDVIQEVRNREPFHVQSGGLSLCRDGFHMSWLYGRYLLACVWAKKILGVTLKDNTFIPKTEFPGEEAREELLSLIRNVVDGYEM